MLSPQLQKRFRPLVEKAWLAQCSRNPQLDAEDYFTRRSWYEGVLRETFHVESTNGIDAHDPKAVDRLFQTFAAIAGDEREIDYWARAEERRLCYLIGKRLEVISQHEGFTADWEYVRSMWKHMNLPLSPEEAPAEHLRIIFQALDTQARRLRKRRAA